MPKPKANLVALRDERERTIQLLSNAFAADLFDMDEFESRVERAQQATSCEALQLLRQDIETDDQAIAGSMVTTTANQEIHQALTAAQPRSGWAVAVLSSNERNGQWRVPKSIKAVGCMGSVELDFREAIMAPGVTELKVTAIMGSVEIIVPPELAVECSGLSLLGAFEGACQSPAIPDLNKPLLRISGMALMGSSEVSMRMVGESARQARKRRKRERKALSKKTPKQLP